MYRILLLTIVSFVFQHKNSFSQNIIKNSKMNKNTSLLYKKDLTPPDATKRLHLMEEHGDKRIDPYYWMRLSDEQKLADTPDKHTQSVLDYLNAENDYKEAMMSHLSEAQESLFEEIKGRIKEDDTSVPYLYNDYYYITRYEKGNEYPIYARKHKTLEAKEEVMLDVNVLAEGYEYYNVSGRSVSPDNTMLVYGEDTLSRRKYTLRFKNLQTGEMLSDVISNTTGGAVWANDNKTLFYTRKDAALRSYKIFKHKLGTDPSEDIEVYHEQDETYSTYVYKTKSKKYIVIGAWATNSQEYRILSADRPDEELTLFNPRKKDLEYSISHFNDHWYILTNKDGAFNFKVMKTPEALTQDAHWQDVIAHREDVYIEGMDLFSNFMVLNERKNANTELRVMPWKGEDYYMSFPEDAYSVGMSVNPDFDTDVIRIGYTSMTTPSSTYDYDTRTREMTLLKQQEVLGSFDKNDYTSERIMVTARDGEQIPVSIVYKKGFEKNGQNPVLLYGYGSYGNSMDPYFSSVRLSLLDRGFGYAIAHIRGGQEKGRLWYENGKFLKKKNTFTDFIDVGDYLVNNKYAAKDELYAMGGSAGGLLMGAVINMRPKLWKGVVAAVPFVDVVTTMLDESIPLTTGEFNEWGNPKDPAYYEYIKSYSPYDNVAKLDYPAMLVTTGYHDSQVQYWEPAKWVAKLRDYKTGNNPLMMHCNMGAGHGGASGRFRRFKEVAMEYAFLLDLAGKL